jgi:hypothetical protein
MLHVLQLMVAEHAPHQHQHQHQHHQQQGASGSSCGGSSAAARAPTPTPARARRSYSLQRVACLRLPGPVSAVVGLDEELLLLAAGNVLALYRLTPHGLAKAAFCFTRAPVVSLSGAACGGPVPAAAAAGGSARRCRALVMAADMHMGLVAHQVDEHEGTGELSLTPLGAHTDVRRVAQVLCLPPELLPAAPPAAAAAAAAAEAAVGAAAAAARAQLAARRRAQQQGQHSSADAGPASQDIDMCSAQGANAGPATATPTATAAGSAAVDVVQRQLAAACMRCLCLDDSGMVVEAAWAADRTVPARWLATTACVPVGRGPAAHGSLQLLQLQASAGALPWSLQQQQALLRGQPAAAAAPAHAPAAVGAVVAASENGCVVCLQRLSPAEGRLLQELQQVVLESPLTRPLLVGRQQVVADASQLLPLHLMTQGQQQEAAALLQRRCSAGAPAAAVAAGDGVAAAVLDPAAAAVAAPTFAPGLPPRQLGALDAQLLRLLLRLPYDIQLALVRDAACGTSLATACEGDGGDGDVAVAAALLCRLQQLVM